MTTFLQNVIDALSLGSIYALTALGIGLIFGILRLINFAHGDFITFAAYALIVPSSAEVGTRLPPCRRGAHLKRSRRPKPVLLKRR